MIFIDNPIRPSIAYLASFFVALSYVSVLYIFPSCRSKPSEKDQNGIRLDRFHPNIVKSRLYAISLSSILSLLFVGFLLKFRSKSHQSKSIHEIAVQTLHLTGLKTSTLPTNSFKYLRVLLQPLILTCILFWGPLYSLLFLEFKLNIKSLTNIRKDGIDIYIIRAIILGPLLEEIVFRGCVIAFHLMVSPLNRLSNKQLIFITPLWFGLAHVHSIWETYLTLGRTNQALIAATIQTVVQFLYTSIFGWYAAFIHLRTGSVFAAVLCHSFCNCMGLPSFFESMRQFPRKRTSIIVHYLVGVWLFSYLVKRWASNRNLFPNSILWNHERA